jgi:hypothetical protein
LHYSGWRYFAYGSYPVVAESTCIDIDRAAAVVEALDRRRSLPGMGLDKYRHGSKTIRESNMRNRT